MTFIGIVVARLLRFIASKGPSFLSLIAVQECAGFRGPFEVLSVNSREVRSSLKNSNLNMSLTAIQECAGFRGPFEVLSVNSREVRSSLKKF